MLRTKQKCAEMQAVAGLFVPVAYDCPYESGRSRRAGALMACSSCAFLARGRSYLFHSHRARTGANKLLTRSKLSCIYRVIIIDHSISTPNCGCFGPKRRDDTKERTKERKKHTRQAGTGFWLLRLFRAGMSHFAAVCVSQGVTDEVCLSR